MDLRELSSRLHQTVLRPELLPAEVHKRVTDAMQNGLSAVVVPPVWVKRVATMLQGSGVRTCATVGFPHGTNKSTIKAIEATSCIKDGAEELWIVPHLPSLIRADLDAVKFELLEIARAARATRRDVVMHVVLEWTMLLTENAAGTDEMLRVACQAARESGCDGVVTSSGFHVAGGIVASGVRDIRQQAQGMKVTANVGWIAWDENEADVQNMFAAGADIVASERAAEIILERARAGRKSQVGDS